MQHPGTQHLPSCQPGSETPCVPPADHHSPLKLKTGPFCSEPPRDAAPLRGLGGGEPCCPPCLAPAGMPPPWPAPGASRRGKNAVSHHEWLPQQSRGVALHPGFPL